MRMRRHQHALAQGLRERVGVGPAEGLGACAPSSDELAPHPVVAQLLAALGQQMGTGRAQLVARRLGEAAKPFGRARLGLELLAQTPRRGYLGVDVDVGDDGGVGGARAPARMASVARVSVASPWWVPAT